MLHSPPAGAPRWRVNLKGGGALNVNPPSHVDLFKCHRSLFCSGRAGQTKGERTGRRRRGGGSKVFFFFLLLLLLIPPLRKERKKKQKNKRLAASAQPPARCLCLGGLRNECVGEPSHLFADLFGINLFSLGQTGQRVELRAYK